MRTLFKPVFGLCIMAAPLFAGALLLEVGNPAANPEAIEKRAVVLARITACHSPEKTTVTASAEGVINGIRQTIPLKVISLSTAGTFAVTREWPEEGNWAVKMIATNPDYKDYATAVVVPIQRNLAESGAAKHYSHAPTEAEVSLSLN
jgi:hypothetical protein